MPSELLTERHDTTLVLTLSDPATRNALSAQACAAGVEALNVAESDDGVRCVLLRGDGAHFCAGLDDAPQAADGLAGFIEALRAFPKPAIAAIEGDALGAGFGLALACDLLVAADDARFELRQVHLPASLPRSRALELLWQPEAITARRLESFGLLNRVVDNGQALPEALRWAERLAQAPADLLASAKVLVVQGKP